jgi:WD40 repeat protein
VKVVPEQTHLVAQHRHTSPLIGCRIDPSGKFVFAGAQDNAIVRWELGSGKKTVLAGHRSWVRALAFAAREKVLFSADWAGQILVWPTEADAPTAKVTVAAHRGWARALALSPDGRTLASCGNDHLVKLWSVPDCKLLRAFEGHECHVYNVGFHPDGRSLVSADLKGKVKVWDLAKGAVAREMDAKVLHKYDPNFMADHGGVRSMAFSRDGGLLACAGITNVSNAFAGIGNPLVVLFDWASGKQKQLLRPRINFNGTAWGVAFHPAGFILGVGGGNGGALWAWKAEQALSTYALTLPNNARDLALHPDGRRLAIPFFDGVARIYDMGPKKT